MKILAGYIARQRFGFFVCAGVFLGAAPFYSGLAFADLTESEKALIRETLAQDRQISQALKNPNISEEEESRVVYEIFNQIKPHELYQEKHHQEILEYLRSISGREKKASQPEKKVELPLEVPPIQVETPQIEKPVEKKSLEKNRLTEAIQAGNVKEFDTCGPYTVISKTKTDPNTYVIDWTVTLRNNTTQEEKTKNLECSSVIFNQDCSKVACQKPFSIDVLDRDSLEVASQFLVSSIQDFEWLDREKLVVVSQDYYQKTNEISLLNSTSSERRSVHKFPMSQSRIKIDPRDKNYIFLKTEKSAPIQANPSESRIDRIHLSNPGEVQAVYHEANRYFGAIDVVGDQLIVENYSNSAFDQKLSFVSLKTGEKVHEFFGHSPAVLKSGQVAFLNYEGSNEEVPYLYNPKKKETARLPHYDRIGAFKSLRAKEGKLTGQFRSVLAADEILMMDPEDGTQKEIYAVSQFRKGAHESRVFIGSTKNYQYPAYLYRPENGKPKGVLVFVHGGKCNGGLFDVNHLSLEITELVEKGYAVLGINYRGNYLASNGYPFVVNRKLEDCGKDELDDIAAARKWVSDHYPDSPTFLWGHSHGAYLSNLAVSKNAEKIKWAGYISANGMWDIRRGGGGYGGSEDDWYVDPDFKLFSLPRSTEGEYACRVKSTTPTIEGFDAAIVVLQKMKGEDSSIAGLRFRFPESYYQEANPIQHVEKIKTPIFLVHGQEDNSVPYEHAQIFLKKATEHGIQVKAYTPANEGHSIFREENWNPYIQAFTQFLEECTQKQKSRP